MTDAAKSLSSFGAEHLRGLTRALIEPIQSTSGAKRNFRSCKRIGQVSSIRALYITILFTSLPINVAAADHEGHVWARRSPDSSVSCRRHLPSTPCQPLDICGGTVSLSREETLKGEELFVIAFEELFVVGRRVSGLADDKAVSSCLDDFDRDNLGVVDAQDAFNLGEQPCKKSQVASGHTNQARYDFGGEAAVR